MKLMAATLFVEIWKRRQSILAWEWDLEMDDQEEHPRPEFEVRSFPHFWLQKELKKL